MVGGITPPTPMNSMTINVPKGYQEIVLVTEGGKRIRLSFMPWENGDHQCVDIKNLDEEHLRIIGFCRGRNSFKTSSHELPTTTATILL
jgi:hypothetical protein